MKAGLFAKKVGMTQIFDESGTILPVTILKTGLCQVSQIKTTSYRWLQRCSNCLRRRKLEKINKATQGHLKKLARKVLNILVNSMFLLLKNLN